jgi:hypothetical protein
MSSTPHSSTTQDQLISDDADLNEDHEHPPSIAVMKATIGYGRHQSVKSAEAVAKYVAAEHPDFDLFPALPSDFHVEFDSQTLEQGPAGDYVQKTTFTVSFGSQYLLEELGQVTVKRLYDCLSDAREQTPPHATTETTVHYVETPTP